MSNIIPPPFDAHFERINAARARELLASNIKDNRKLSPSRAARYAEDISEGFWAPTHQGIAIDESGHLMDGQHRLEGLLLADHTHPGITIDVMVSVGVPRDTFFLMDGGFLRSAQSFLNGQYRSSRTALARTMMRIEENDGTASLANVVGGNYASHRILHYLEDNPKMREYGEAYSRSADRASRSGTFLGTSNAGLLIGGYIAGIKDSDRWTDWWEDVEAIVQRDGLEKGNPVKALSKAAPVGGNFTRFAYIRAVYAGVKYQRRLSLTTIRSTSLGEVKVW